MKVSIIVPVYNVEKYIEKCLESLVNQTLKDIEVIVVNDGSPDKSQLIIDRYEKNYPNIIKAYKKTNGGLSDARNFGLRYATGEFVGFIDSDDFVDLNMYELLYKKAVDTNADVIACNLHHTYDDTEDTEYIEKYTDKNELIAYGCSVAWNKIYKRSWLLETEVIFPVGINHEDIDFFCLIVPYIRKISYIDAPCVHYVQRADSINNEKSKKLLDIHKIFLHLNEEYIKRDFVKIYGEALEALAIRVLLGSALSRFCKISDRKLRKTIINQNWKFLNDNYPNWKKNKIISNKKGLKNMYYSHCSYMLYKIIAIIMCIKSGI